MKIDVKIGDIRENANLKAYAIVVLDDCFVVNGVRILSGKHGDFVAMPSYKNSKGEYTDYCHPITKEFKQELDAAVLEAYEQKQFQCLDHEDVSKLSQQTM